MQLAPHNCILASCAIAVSVCVSSRPELSTPYERPNSTALPASARAAVSSAAGKAASAIAMATQSGAVGKSLKLAYAGRPWISLYLGLIKNTWPSKPNEAIERSIMFPKLPSRGLAPTMAIDRGLRSRSKAWLGIASALSAVTELGRRALMGPLSNQRPRGHGLYQTSSLRPSQAARSNRRRAACPHTHRLNTALPSAPRLGYACLAGT